LERSVKRQFPQIAPGCAGALLEPQEIVIPRGVFDELSHPEAPLPVRRWIEVVPCQDMESFNVLE
jgi:hypothetical protein